MFVRYSLFVIRAAGDTESDEEHKIRRAEQSDKRTERSRATVGETNININIKTIPSDVGGAMGAGRTRSRIPAEGAMRVSSLDTAKAEAEQRTRNGETSTDGYSTDADTTIECCSVRVSVQGRSPQSESESMSMFHATRAFIFIVVFSISDVPCGQRSFVPPHVHRPTFDFFPAFSSSSTLFMTPSPGHSLGSVVFTVVSSPAHRPYFPASPERTARFFRAGRARRCRSRCRGLPRAQ